MRRFDGACRSESRTDGFAATSKTSEVMKPNRTRYDHLRKILERTIDFDRCVALGRSQRDHLCSIVSGMINRFDALRYEGSQEFNLLLRRNCAMYSRSEDNCEISG